MADLETRRPFLAVALGASLLLGVFALGGPALAQDEASDDGQVVDRIVLRVNDRIATLWEYQRRLASVRRDVLGSAGLPAERQRELLQDAPRQVLRSMFDDLLMSSRADQLDLTVSPVELDEQIRMQAEQFGLEDEQALRAALAKEGLTLEEYRENLEGQQLWRMVTGREVLPRIEVADEELRDLYREHEADFRVPERRRIREIVVLDTNQLDADERNAIASTIAESWRGGADPETLAQERGPEVAMLFDIGWVTREDLSEELAASVFGLEDGQVSAPVSARGGLHVVELLETEQASVKPFEEVRAQLLQRERSARFEDELAVYLRELEAKAYFDGSGLPPELSDFQTASGRLVREGSSQLLERAASATEPAKGENGDG